MVLVESLPLVGGDGSGKRKRRWMAVVARSVAKVESRSVLGAGEVDRGLRGTESSERTVTNCHLQRNTRFRSHNNPAPV